MLVLWEGERGRKGGREREGGREGEGGKVMTEREREEHCQGQPRV